MGYSYWGVQYAGASWVVQATARRNELPFTFVLARRPIPRPCMLRLTSGLVCLDHLVLYYNIAFPLLSSHVFPLPPNLYYHCHIWRTNRSTVTFPFRLLRPRPLSHPIHSDSLVIPQQLSAYQHHQFRRHLLYYIGDETLFNTVAEP